MFEPAPTIDNLKPLTTAIAALIKRPRFFTALLFGFASGLGLLLARAFGFTSR